ncbi:MAG TPA: M20/M25/M40 family metallo-hydrolase, partial [Acidimicrobiales bacterium]
MTTDWRARVLEQIDADESAMVGALRELVRIPSVSGSDAEHEIQDHMAAALTSDGLEVDHWPLPLADLMAAHDFPGSEVERTEAWGLVGRLPGSGDGPSLMLNGHVDVVPEGDLGAWTGRDAFSGSIVDGALHGRGACDMKAG